MVTAILCALGSWYNKPACPTCVLCLPDCVHDEQFANECRRVNPQCARYYPTDMSIYGFAIRYLPHSFLTLERCMRAVASDARLIDYVPEEYVQQLYPIIINAPQFSLAHIPWEKMTFEVLGKDPQEVCMRTVKKYPLDLAFVPSEGLGPRLTYELCKIAVSGDGRALAFVPEHLKTRGLVLIAVLGNGYAIRYGGVYATDPEIIQESNAEKEYRRTNVKPPRFTDC
jgi:hypothetical protein